MPPGPQAVDPQDPATEKLFKRNLNLIRRAGTSLPFESPKSPKKTRLNDENSPQINSVLTDTVNTPPCTPMQMPNSISQAAANNRARSMATLTARSLSARRAPESVDDSCEKIASLLSEIKRRHDEKVISVEIELRKAEEKVEKLEGEVAHLQRRVQEWESREGDIEEKNEKLKVALAEIDRLREHSRAVGHYLINHSVKDEDSESSVKEELV
ncbi:hypothetical protein H0H92_008763 [Tricholoma furcatifolium]|nr:hypothetical protein H0H92_008763 [Tricholoma furcatifolium]